jgi:hypothetical protein
MDFHMEDHLFICSWSLILVKQELHPNVYLIVFWSFWKTKVKGKFWFYQTSCCHVEIHLQNKQTNSRDYKKLLDRLNPSLSFKN